MTTTCSAVERQMTPVYPLLMLTTALLFVINIWQT